jgi:hypothetical protein
LVLDGDIPQFAIDEIKHTFQDTLGENISVDFEYLDDIPVLPSGKHQYAISELNPNIIVRS